jgi:hypothetical protein
LKNETPATFVEEWNCGRKIPVGCQIPNVLGEISEKVL